MKKITRRDFFTSASAGAVIVAGAGVLGSSSTKAAVTKTVTPTAGATPVLKGTDIFRVLDPVSPVIEKMTLPNPPTLDTLDGKLIWVLSREDGSMKPIFDELQKEAPKANFAFFAIPETTMNLYSRVAKDKYPKAVIAGTGF
jgi:hypothetical protein